MFQASQRRQTVLEPVVSVTSQWMTEGRYKWVVGEELGSPDWELLQQEMEGVPAGERSKGVKVGSCHLWCVAGGHGTDQLEEKKKGWGLSEPGIYDQRH